MAKLSVRSIAVFSFLLAGLFAIFFSIFDVPYFINQIARLGDDDTLFSNLGFFVLINTNIIVVMVLVFIVVKNIVKLILDRRRNILGSKLRTRLVVAFVGLSLIPSVLLFVVSKGIIGSVLQGWFSPQIASVVDSTINISRYYYDSVEAQVHRNVKYLATDVSDFYPLLLEDSGSESANYKRYETLRSFLENKRAEYGLYEIRIVNNGGKTIISTDFLNKKPYFNFPVNLNYLFESQDGSIVVRPERSMSGEFMRGYAPIYYSPTLSSNDAHLPSSFSLVVSYWISPELNTLLADVLNSYDDYKELSSYRRPLASSYLLGLVIITLLIVFAAIWVGFYLARGLSVPIGLLAQGTQEVSQGNLDYKITEGGGDEVSLLIRSFNAMTKELKDKTSELVERRRYMETVLEHLGVGVVSINPQSMVTTINHSARTILGLQEEETFVGKNFAEIFPQDLSQHIVSMLEKIYGSESAIRSQNVTASINNLQKHLHVTVTPLFVDEEHFQGAVILLDDVTELVSAQRMSAWREVARRIAHEIKNPLTPIQLSAQRVQRKFVGSKESSLSPAEVHVIDESTEVIVKQVEILRTLVNEFSRFARMPKAKLAPCNINDIIRDSVSVYKDTHPEVTFHLALTDNAPELLLDKEQMSRVFINLIDNSLASIEEVLKVSQLHVVGGHAQQSPDKGVITIRSAINNELGVLDIFLSDNGVGIKDEDKQKLFEPYFSTKKGGTGLGLAIVSSIISDHSGYIRVKDNSPRGVTFVIELPLS